MSVGEMLGDIWCMCYLAPSFCWLPGHTEEKKGLQQQKGTVCEIRRVCRVSHEASVSCDPLTPGSSVLQWLGLVVQALFSKGVRSWYMADMNEYFEPGSGVLERVLLNLPRGSVSLPQNSLPFLVTCYFVAGYQVQWPPLPPASVLSQGLKVPNHLSTHDHKQAAGHPSLPVSQWDIPEWVLVAYQMAPSRIEPQPSSLPAVLPSPACRRFWTSLPCFLLHPPPCFGFLATPLPLLLPTDSRCSLGAAFQTHLNQDT